MDGLKLYTFEGTSADVLYNMTNNIPAGSTLILKQARFDIVYTGVNIPKSVNISIGKSVSSDYVIDNYPDNFCFKVGLDYNPHTIGVALTNISITYPDTGYKISGPINKYCQLTLLDTNYQPLTGLVYFFLQFNVV